MGNICTWLLEKRLRLFEYFEKYEPVQTPPNWWWVVVAGINALTAQVNIVFTKLQAKDLLVSQQSVELTHLTSLICIQVGVDGPHSQEELDVLDNSTNFISGRWSISHYNVVRYFLK